MSNTNELVDLNTSNLVFSQECNKLKIELDEYKGLLKQEKDKSIVTQQMIQEYRNNHNIIIEQQKVIKKNQNDFNILKKTFSIFQDRINKCLREQNKNIIIARNSYHNINNKYWWSSIFILVFSSLITFIEAIRLIIENTENKKIKLLTYLISISSIFLGILITIITGYIKFNDYQNKLEIISSRLSLLLQYQKKFEVIKFTLSTYSLPDKEKSISESSNNIDNNNKLHILTDTLMNGFISDLNKLEEDIQNNELLKYITDKNELKYYKNYIDTYTKNILYDNYIKTIKKFIKYDEIAMNDNKYLSENEINTVISAIVKTMEHKTKDESIIRKIINKFSKKKQIIDINLLQEIKTHFYLLYIY